MKRFGIGLLAGLCMLCSAVQAQTCQCADMGDIRNRITEATAAISAYSTEMQKMVEQIMRTQEPLPYTPERRAKLQGRVQTALNAAMAGRLGTNPTIAGENPGGTSNVCSVTINLHPSATACMRESVSRHEAYHRDQCLKTRSAGAVLGSVVSGKDRFERDGAALTDYAQEEIGGYTTELQFLQGELARLSQSDACKPKPKPVELRSYTARGR